jgi:hypothetical protein
VAEVAQEASDGLARITGAAGGSTRMGYVPELVIPHQQTKNLLVSHSQEELGPL